MSVAQLTLRPPHGKGDSEDSVGVLHLRLKVIGTTASVEADVKTATQDIEQRGIVPSTEAADSTAVAVADSVIEQSEQSEMHEALGSLIAKLDVIVGIIDKLSKVKIYLYAFSVHCNHCDYTGPPVPRCCVASHFGFV